MDRDKHQLAAQRKLRAAARAAAAPNPRVVVLSDPHRTPDLISLARRLPRGWGLIYRHFGAPDRAAVAAALAVAARGRLTLLIGGDPRLAKAIGADGVHWPERRLREARRWRGAFKMMTGAAHSRSALRRCARSGLDAALLSTVFPSTSATASAPMGPIRLRNLARKGPPIAIYGLGGVHAGTAARIAEFTGLAMVEGAAAAFART